MELTIHLAKSKKDSPELFSTRCSRVLNSVYLILALLSSYIYCIFLLNFIIACVSRGSNPAIFTFCTLILIYLLLTSVTWHPNLKKPVPLEAQRIQAKNNPT